MSPLHPSKDALQGAFYSPLSATNRTRYQARAELFPVHSSVVEDAKGKAKQLSAEATAEFEKASAKAQAKAGRIELYSGKYYAACTFGGLMACVSAQFRSRFNENRRYHRPSLFLHIYLILIYLI